MYQSDRRKIVEELEWLSWPACSARAAEKVLTDPERKDILKRGFVTKELWASLRTRIPDKALTREDLSDD